MMSRTIFPSNAVALTLLATTAVVAAGCTASSAGQGTSTGPAPQSQFSLSQDSAQPEQSPEGAVAADLAESMTLEEKAAALLMVHFPGLDTENFQRWSGALQPAGIILMGDNTELGSSGAANLAEAAQIGSQWPLLIGIDQEGGVVSRLDEDPAAGPEQLRTMTPQQVQEQQFTRAQFLRSLGINTNFGIIADVTDDPASFIWQRVLGTSIQQAAENVGASVTGENEGGVYSTLKHFPGHGAAPGDSHQVIPETEIELEAWEDEVALPFQAGIDAGAELVMMGHLAFTSVSPLPASLSPEWVDILRDDMGFEGVIVTDDMRMLSDSGLPEYADGAKNVVRALEAGVDLILYVFPTGSDPVTASNELVQAIVAATLEGHLSEVQLTESVARVLELRLPLA